MKKQILLEIKDLNIHFTNGFSLFPPPKCLNLQINTGECIGIFGQSGCGKTSIALSIINIHPSFKKSGQIFFKKEEITFCSKKFLGTSIGMVFQSPLLSLNPGIKIYKQISEGLVFHKMISKDSAKEIAIEWLDKLDIKNPELVADLYPHHLSGGQRQRVCLAMALAIKPELLILDEPMTALDFNTQEKMIQILKNEQFKSQMSMLIISHDMNFLKNTCQKIYNLDEINEDFYV